MLSILNTRQVQRKLLVVTDMFITLIVVMVLWVYAYIQAHKIIYMKYMWYFVYRLYPNKDILTFLIDKFLNIYVITLK